MPSIDFDDLIGIPFLDGGQSSAGTNCAGVGRMALERMGAVLRPEDLPVTDGALVRACVALASSPGDSAWEHLGAEVGLARALGDLVLSRSAEGSHVAVMVDTERRICLSACAPIERGGEVLRRGETFACPARRISGVVGVYRLRQLAEEAP